MSRMHKNNRVATENDATIVDQLSQSEIEANEKILTMLYLLNNDSKSPNDLR